VGAQTRGYAKNPSIIIVYLPVSSSALISGFEMAIGRLCTIRFFLPHGLPSITSYECEYKSGRIQKQKSRGEEKGEIITDSV
jgi:hypothetical protein